jgi:membrane-bound lytic murein transglycosylase B
MAKLQATPQAKANSATPVYPSDARCRVPSHLYHGACSKETPASYIAFQDTEHAATAATFVDFEPEAEAQGCDDAACEEEHAPMDDPAEDAVVQEASSPTRKEPVSEVLLGVLAKNKIGTWFSCQRSRFPLWSFFCPADASLTWEERGKCDQVECLICYAQR